jgi:hypothetical protein
MSGKPSFFSELKRRNVYKVAVAYAIVGWLVIQIAKQTVFLSGNSQLGHSVGDCTRCDRVSHCTRYYPLHGDPRFEAVVQKVVKPATNSKQ